MDIETAWLGRVFETRERKRPAHDIRPQTALKLAVIPSEARNLALTLAPRYPKRRARFLPFASLRVGMTFLGFWVPVSRRAWATALKTTPLFPEEGSGVVDGRDGVDQPPRPPP